MTRTITLANLRTAVLQRGGVENSADLTPSVLNGYVNEGIAEFWDILKSKRDDRLVTSTTLTTSINVDNVTLPSDFYELRKLEIVDSNSPSGYTRLRKVDLDATHRYYTLYGKRYRYRLQGNAVYLHPTPQAVETVRMFYIPYAPLLVNDSDTVDGISGYEELITALAWRRCLVRQDLSTASMDAEIQRLAARISAAADGRDDEPFALDPRGVTGTAYDDDNTWWY